MNQEEIIQHLILMNQEEIIRLIRNLTEELDGTMQESLRCDSYGRQSRIITIEYDVKETK